MKTKQIVVVEVERGRVSYDLYEVRDEHRLAHGEIVDDESADQVIERLSAYYGNQAVVTRHVAPAMTGAEMPVGISVRHAHLSRGDCDELFGVGYELERRRNVTQPGQSVTRETVDLVGPRGELRGVGIIIPLRSQTQIELARTDAIHLGIDPPLRESGNLADTPGLRLYGPRGYVALDHGVIIAQRHVHMSPSDALRFGVHDHDLIRVAVTGDRELVLGDVLVRIAPDFVLDLHLDTDEANAAGLTAHSTVRFAGVERRRG